MDSEKSSVELKREARILRYAECLKIAAFLEPHYVEAGRPSIELVSNIQMIENYGKGRVDSSLQEEFSKNVPKCQQKSVDVRQGREGFLARADYYRAVGLHSMWCAYQHLAVGGLKAAIEAAGKALGHLAVDKHLRLEEVISSTDDRAAEESAGLAKAAEAESDFLDEYREKGIL